MRLYTIVSGTIVIFFTCSLFATTKASSQTKENLVGTGLASRKEGRLLRIASDSQATEDRGLISWLNDRAQMNKWLADKADDIVMKELGLTGRTGTALMGHRNFKRLQEFWTNTDDKMMNAMIDDGVSTNRVWRGLKLDQLSTEELKNSDKFLYYLRYATKYDDRIFWRSDELTGPVVYYGGTKEEMFVKVWIWAAADRPKDYVRWLLLLNDTPDEKLLANPYYAEFVRLQLPKKWNALDR